MTDSKPRLDIDPERVNLLDPRALALALGIIGALGLFAATAVLLLRGGEVVGPNLSLLAQYLVGYRVSWAGAFVGAGYGFAIGFAAGWTFAQARNGLIRAYMRHLWRRSERDEASDLLDHLS